MLNAQQPFMELPFAGAFGHPVTTIIVVIVAAALVIATIAIWTQRRSDRVGSEKLEELWLRTQSWYWIAAMMIVPILLGRVWTCLFFFALAIFCFLEFSKATGLAKYRTQVVACCLAIACIFIAAIDHWLDFFTTSWAFGICVIFTAALWADRPNGYLQRVSLSLIGFALFGISLGHMAFLSNDGLYRPILLWILFSVGITDVFAFICGRLLGRRKLLPKTSPNKTIEGAVGAVVLTTAVSATIAYFIFQGTVLAGPVHLVLMGVFIAVFGQCGDLVVSSVKRDIDVKDMSNLIPGHGGLLDRFDSLLLVSPILFHYINYFRGVGMLQPTRWLTGFLDG